MLEYKCDFCPLFLGTTTSTFYGKRSGGLQTRVPQGESDDSCLDDSKDSDEDYRPTPLSPGDVSGAVMGVLTMRAVVMRVPITKAAVMKTPAAIMITCQHQFYLCKKAISCYCKMAKGGVEDDATELCKTSQFGKLLFLMLIKSDCHFSTSKTFLMLIFWILL